MISTHGKGAIDIIVNEVGSASDQEAIVHLESISSFNDSNEAFVAKAIIEQLKMHYKELF
ncbi:MAG: hypothetical protein KDC92_05130 [Bacteroidetes bacterium]|nr:hypothetical protein [Bacteroidota bacterium]